MLCSSLFHSIIVDGKKQFFKKVSFFKEENIMYISNNITRAS